jgi:uncharacterized membrane protein
MGKLKHISKADKNGSRKRYTHAAQRRGWKTLDLDHPITAKYFAAFMIAVGSFIFLFVLYVLACSYVFSAAFASENALPAAFAGIALSLLAAYLALRRYGAAKLTQAIMSNEGGDGAIHFIGFVLASVLAIADSLIRKVVNKRNEKS